MKIDVLGSGENPAWDDFVLNHADGLFFHLSAWQEVIKATYQIEPLYLVATQGQTIVGVLPCCIVNRPLVGKAIISNPFCVSAGALVSSTPVADEFLAYLKNLGKELQVKYIEIRDRWVPDWQVQNNFATFEKTLVDSHDKNFLNIPNRQRAVIKKAFLNKLDVTNHLDLPRFLSVYGESLRNLGTPIYPLKYFSSLLFHFPKNISITSVSKAGTDLTSVLSFSYKNKVSPYYGGGTPAARQFHSFPFMYWQLMRRAVDEGYQKFDFGRSPLGSGAYSFKKNLGFTPRVMPYSFYSMDGKPIPNLTYEDNKVKMLTQIWSHLPVFVTNRVGPMGAVYAV